MLLLRGEAAEVLDPEGKRPASKLTPCLRMIFCLQLSKYKRRLPDPAASEGEDRKISDNNKRTKTYERRTKHISNQSAILVADARPSTERCLPNDNVSRQHRDKSTQRTTPPSSFRPEMKTPSLVFAMLSWVVLCDMGLHRILSRSSEAQKSGRN